MFVFVGIRVVKLYAWEQSFTDKVDRVRQLEVKKLKVKKTKQTQLSIFIVIGFLFCIG
jgi:hypothetical protein